jgi:sialate O-acetylesterase
VACIKPLMPYRIRGVIWWQGETDSRVTRQRYDYYARFRPMITGWRREWGQGDFPFLYVQLSSITRRGCIGETRDAMRRALALPNTGMAVSFDLTNGEVVPLRKKQAGSLHPHYAYSGVGKRLALAARAVAYGEKVEWSGPLFEQGELSGGKLVLSFTHLADGLVAKGDREPGRFEVQAGAAGARPGDRGEFKPVRARVSDDRKTVVLDVAGLRPPLRVRYAYGEMPKGNLFNSAGLPASPFISDPVPAQ